MTVMFSIRCSQDRNLIYGTISYYTTTYVEISSHTSNSSGEGNKWVTPIEREGRRDKYGW